ncbi:hypothetical protein FRC17_007191 [Serendipita sp. 399]|nr:hypothetical protein FRC17_007191 [Serendipita sp. 399]
MPSHLDSLVPRRPSMHIAFVVSRTSAYFLGPATDRELDSSKVNMTSYQQSEEFPDNYGDFRLISSDGVAFSFPRFFLSHVSPVFEDMLKLGPTNSSAQQQQQETEQLILTEDSVTLDQLLRFFDPAKKPLPINAATIERLLEAARKYQVEQVFDYWEDQMMVRDVGRKVIKIRDPLVSFLLAHHFERHNLMKLALRELVRIPDTKLWLPQGYIVDYRLMLHIMKLRQERAAQLISRLDAFQKSISWHSACCNAENVAQLQQHTVSLILKLIKEPSWESFRKNMGLWPGCKGHYAGSRQLFNDWKASLIEEDEALPDLPNLPS